jgi:hypothetical protein
VKTTNRAPNLIQLAGSRTCTLVQVDHNHQRENIRKNICIVDRLNKEKKATFEEYEVRVPLAVISMSAMLYSLTSQTAPCSRLYWKKKMTEHTYTQGSTRVDRSLIAPL